jgi:transcriptional regulator with XRE-family HTH domain
VASDDLGAKVGVAQTTVSLIERGHLETLGVRTLTAVLTALEARLEANISWRGGAIDRLTDERHARLVEIVVHRLQGEHWQVHAEVSYGRYRQTGAIDVLAWHERSRSLLVIEVKSEITSVEETLRRHDEKVRLASALARERFRGGR